MNNSWAQKRIPTILGLVVLVVGLVAGVLFLGQGFGAFSPRATAQTTPKNVEVTNVTDTGFTVSFLTDEATIGFIKYGTATNNQKLQVGDDRDQISGTVSPYTTHYISVRELQPSSSYFFTLGTNSGANFDDNGQPFTVTTTARSTNPKPALTIYGNVLDGSNQPASGAMVYAQISGVGKISSLVKDSGSWSIPLSSARTNDGTAYANVQSSSSVSLFVQGLTESSTASQVLTVAEAQPAAAIILGLTTQTTGTGNQTQNDFVATQPPATLPPDFPIVNDEASVNTTSGNTIVDLQAETNPIVNTDQPMIVGQAPANTQITIEVNSDTQITSQVQTDSSGSYVLDLSSLQKTLEPGVHTVTISYTDPQTGKVVTQQKTFTVEGNSSGSQQLALAPTPTPLPYSTSNPYPLTDETPTPTATASSTFIPDYSEDSVSSASTKGGVPISGAVTTTFVLIGAGLLLFIAGSWSFVFSRQSIDESEL